MTELSSDESLPEVDMDTLRQWLESGEPVTVLDVRPARERAEWSIPQSLHADAYDALWAGDPHALDDVAVPPERTVVTVCAAGRTSRLAAERLRLRGFKVFSLLRGMKGWSLAWNTAEVPVATEGVRVIQVRRTGKGCLSYIIAAGGDAVVIDPSVQVKVYLRIARAEGWIIRSVIETHVHADHLSRARLLSRVTGATLIIPAQSRISFPSRAAIDGDKIDIGSSGVVLSVLRTPGHTAESTCYALEQELLFTGDTLFLSSIGRPDLEAGRGEAESRAHDLFHSLARIFALPESMLVLPGHTGEPVAFDRKPLASTLRDVRTRIALLGEPEQAFVSLLLARIPETPQLFPDRILERGWSYAGRGSGGTGGGGKSLRNRVSQRRVCCPEALFLLSCPR